MKTSIGSTRADTQTAQPRSVHSASHADSGYRKRVIPRLATVSDTPAAAAATVVAPIVMRRVIGDRLRSIRLGQERTLREVSGAARVSLGYLSEVERGQKEASSELLSAICGALSVPLSQLLREVSDDIAAVEAASAPARVTVAA